MECFDPAADSRALLQSVILLPGSVNLILSWILVLEEREVPHRPVDPVHVLPADHIAPDLFLERGDAEGGCHKGVHYGRLSDAHPFHYSDQVAEDPIDVGLSRRQEGQEGGLVGVQATLVIMDKLQKLGEGGVGTEALRQPVRITQGTPCLVGDSSNWQAGDL